jgi:AcrR family transcriptional regulator
MPVKSQSTTPKRQARSRALERDGFGRQDVTEIQRARMITAMIDVVRERGRAGATVAHVVARSGVSRRTFYEVFDDFEDCFLAALDRSIACASEYVLDGYDPSEKWRPRIRGALIGLLEFLEDEPAMGRLCIVETLSAGPKVNERREHTVEAMIAVVEEGRQESRTVAALPQLTTEGIVGGILSVLHARLLAFSPEGGPASASTDSGSAGGEGNAEGRKRSEGHRHTEGHEHTEGHTEGRRQAGEGGGSLLALTGSLMGMIVLPYLGPAAAYKESERPAPRRRRRVRASAGDPLRDLDMRLTYRTVRVLLAIAELTGQGSHPSNREIGAAAGISDQGQISKLLSRLERLGLVENAGPGQVRGASNAWALTKKGFEVEQLVAS